MAILAANVISGILWYYTVSENWWFNQKIYGFSNRFSPSRNGFVGYLWYITPKKVGCSESDMSCLVNIKTNMKLKQTAQNIHSWDISVILQGWTGICQKHMIWLYPNIEDLIPRWAHVASGERDADSSWDGTTYALLRRLKHCRLQFRFSLGIAKQPLHFMKYYYGCIYIYIIIYIYI